MGTPAPQQAPKKGAEGQQGKRSVKATSTLFVRIDPGLKAAVAAMASQEKRDQVDVVERLLAVGMALCSRFPESINQLQRQSIQSGEPFEKLLLEWIASGPAHGDVA